MQLNIDLLDVVALTEDLPERNLYRVGILIKRSGPFFRKTSKI